MIRNKFSKLRFNIRRSGDIGTLSDGEPMLHNNELYVGTDEGNKQVARRIILEGPDYDVEIVKEDIVDLIYPVGSIYMSMSSTSPVVLFGGLWERLSAGRVLVNINESDTDFNTPNKQGGSKTHSLTTAQLPGHTHTYDKSATPTSSTTPGNVGATTLTAAQIQHTHSLGVNGYAKISLIPGIWVYGMRRNTVTAWSNTHRTPTTNEGDTLGTNTGGAELGGRTETVSMSSPSSHTHSSAAHTHPITFSSTNSSSTGSGNAHNNLQPYLTCYMWRRTA